MKQPQLGKKVAELRFKKGLTQTELAEQCNLSLRTIQRIEATEVTPRSYTLKVIFKNLEYDYIVEEKKIITKKNGSIKNLLLLILTLVSVTLILVNFLPKNNNKFITQTKNTIIQNQKKLKNWVDYKQIDSVMTLYDDNACILNSKCGKIQIRHQFNRLMNDDFKWIEYNTISINVSEKIAIEKYESLYKFNGKTKTQIGVIEWNLINDKWLIVNDMFRDK